MSSADYFPGNPHPDAHDFPRTGRIAAVDYGTVRVGIAICDPDRRLASPLEVHASGQSPQDASYYLQLAKEERIGGWIVGLPLHGDGRESESSARCRFFARWLRKVTAKPVRLFDERFTTKHATSRLQPAGMTRKRVKKRIDAIAAQVLLEAFLEAAEAHPETIPGRNADGPV